MSDLTLPTHRPGISGPCVRVAARSADWVQPSGLKAAMYPCHDRVIVVASGELDIDTAPQLEGVLAAALGRSRSGVDLDLSRVAFCDCCGLNGLLRVRRRALDQGKALVVRAASVSVTRLLALTDTFDLLTAPGGIAFEPGASLGRPGVVTAGREVRRRKPGPAERDRPTAAGFANPAGHRHGTWSAHGLLQPDSRPGLEGPGRPLSAHQHQTPSSCPGPAGDRPRTAAVRPGAESPGSSCETARHRRRRISCGPTEIASTHGAGIRRTDLEKHAWMFRAENS